MFLGIASVLQLASTSKERFPIAVGIANSGSGKFQTVLVKPPESWGIIKLESEQERKEREKKKEAKRLQILAHITDEELIKKGKAPEEVAEIVLSMTKGNAVYSIDRKHDMEMLNKLSPIAAGEIKLLSTLALANELSSPERARNLQLHYKLSIGLYPKNKADIRWVAPWIDHCVRNIR